MRRNGVVFALGIQGVLVANYVPKVSKWVGYMPCPQGFQDCLVLLLRP